VVFGEDPPGQPNYLRFELSPRVVIAMGARSKLTGEAMVGEHVELVARHDQSEDLMPYERLLDDAMRGDPTLFAREDAVEASWRVVDPVLGEATPLYDYPPGTWGPPDAGRLSPPDGGWHNPRAREVRP
jgi:glucose-6-phosphate 1-dehydrogenase